MPLPTGQWNIVSGGYNEILDITNVGLPGDVGNLPGNAGAASRRLRLTLPLTVSGTLQLEPNVTLAISGTWNESHQQFFSSTQIHPRRDKRPTLDIYSMGVSRSLAAHPDFQPHTGIFWQANSCTNFPWF